MKTLFIGGGAMASALIGGILQGTNRAKNVIVVDPAEAQRARLEDMFPGVRCSAELQPILLDDVDLVVLAVKPQQMHTVTRQIRPLVEKIPLMLSIAAGVRITTMSRWLGGYAYLVRAMPNTPALVGAGISAVYATPKVDGAAREKINRLLFPVGDILWVSDETRIDAMTAISGSGPAYVFYFLESLQEAAQMLGMQEDRARFVALRVVEGSLKLAQHDERAFAQLRADVTSKGGTTEHALQVLDVANVRHIICEAIKAARNRAIELGSALDAEGADE
ncbi:MAG: pyrroline-5-carboxylate reductase [Burkholderiales bacterium]|nr:pyrroline-5-carboxylate reductase [Burkholderiales bacterium]